MNLEVPSRTDIHELTPVMDEAAMQLSQELSRNRLNPPVVIPGYVQKEFLGRGAFGEVWKAVDSNNGRTVAIKYFKRGGSVDWSHMAREVEKLRYLFSDRHVVQLFDVGWESDPPYYIMEFMNHGSLEDRLSAGPLSVAESLSIIREVALGLIHAHDKGVLHCDLKPANIMMDEDGQPRLCDFGQARLRQDQTASLGTFFYMAPDQADLHALPDARWDVYALGAILYRMLTGQLPYSVDEADLKSWHSRSLEERLDSYRNHILQSPRPSAHHHVRGVDKMLAEIVDRCLKSNPKHRYHNVQAVLAAIDHRAARLANRSLLIVGGIGPIAVAVLLASVAWFVFHNSIQLASDELVSRTKEGDAFAAESVAARLGMEVDRRWRILEHEADSVELQQLLVNLPGDSSASLSVVHRWMAARHEYWNGQFGDMGKASYWFVLDQHGHLQSISPMEDSLMGAYFGFRDYFHGQGVELSKDQAVPPPITRAYRSAVFRSQPDNDLAVAFSVPIRDSTTDEGSVIGVLIMETILKNISDFRGNRKQAASLIDLRPDQIGKRGLIVDHPQIPSMSTQASAVGEFYLGEGMLNRIAAIHQEHLTRAGLAQSAVDDKAAQKTIAVQHDSIIDDYDNPLTPHVERDCFAAVEPVFVSRGNEAAYDTGWCVIIEEQRAETIAPLAKVWRLIVGGGTMGLALVVVLLSVLWSFVLIINNRSTTKPIVRWGSQTPSGFSSHSSGTEASAAEGESHVPPPMLSSGRTGAPV